MPAGPDTICGISSKDLGTCTEGINENTEFCYANPLIGYHCSKKKDKPSYPKIYEQIKAKNGAVVEVPAVVAPKPVVEVPAVVAKDDFVCGVEVSRPFKRSCQKGVSTHQGLCKKNPNGTGCNKASSKTWEQLERELLGPAPVVPEPAIVIEAPKPVVPAIPPATPVSNLLTKIPKQSIKVYVLEDDFIIPGVTGVANKAGTFGEAVPASFKSDGKKIILKKYKSYNYNGEIPSDIYREVAILQYLNQFPETKTVQFYGICLDKARTSLFLVLEILESDLHGITLGYWDNPAKRMGRLDYEQYRIIFYKLVQAFNAIHCLGIVHNDIKPGNLMISSTDIRVIDFGLADFLGLEPLAYTVKNIYGTPITVAPDDNRKINGYVVGNRKNYNSDMFAIGATMIHMARIRYDYLFVDKSAIYSDNGSTVKTKNVSAQLRDPTIFGPLGFDLLLKIMNPDAHQRWGANRALTHPYFAGLAPDVPINRSIVGGRIYNPSMNGLLANLFNYNGKAMTKYTANEIINKQYELSYMDSLVNNLGNIVINPQAVMDTSRYYTVLNSLFESDYVLNTLPGKPIFDDFDIYVNSFQLMKRVLNIMPNYPVLSGVCCLSIYENIFWGVSIATLSIYATFREAKLSNTDILRHKRHILVGLNADMDIISPWTVATYYCLYLEHYSKSKKLFRTIPNFQVEFKNELLHYMLLFFISAVPYTEGITVNELVLHAMVVIISENLRLEPVVVIRMLSDEGLCINMDYTMDTYANLSQHYDNIIAGFRINKSLLGPNLRQLYSF